MRESYVNTTELKWETASGYPDGTRWKILRRGPNDEVCTAILMLAPGFSVNTHKHLCDEVHYVLRGEYEEGDRHYRAGSYRRIPRNADHGPMQSEEGAVVLVSWER